MGSIGIRVEPSFRLAQLARAPDCDVREVESSSPGWTNTHGLKITEESLLPFYNTKKWIDILVSLDKAE